VLTVKERQRRVFSLACADYVLLNPLKGGLVKKPGDWPYLGAVIPGYPRANPFDAGYWPWFWPHYFAVREPGLRNGFSRRAKWNDARSADVSLR